MADRKALLKDAVFQLVTYHQDVNQILSEVQSIGTKPLPFGNDGCRELSGVYKQCLLNGLKEVSELSTAETCANTLKQMITEMKSIKNTDRSALEEKIRSHVRMMKVMMKEQYFNRPRFLNILCNEKCLPLCVLCILNTEDVLSFESYLKFKCKDSKFIQMFGEEFISSYNKNSKDSNEILSLLVNYSFPENLDSDAVLKKISSSILLWILQNFLHLSEKASEEAIDIQLVPQDNFICSETSLKKYCMFLLQNILVYNPVYSVFESFTQQKNWKYCKLPLHLTEVFKQVLVVTDPQNMLEMVKQTVETDAVNWYYCCSFWATFLVCYDKSSRDVEGYLTNLLKIGFEDSNVDLITNTFLIGRQSCLEGSHVFMSYQDWFQELFGDSSRSICNSRKTFSTLMKVLTDLVPFEPPSCLKVHILRPPFTPPKCKELLSDYVILAKTRLADLKEPLEQVGVFEVTDSSSSSKFQNQIEEDVQKALSAFETNSKMPSAVMEASIFRKSYYIGKFLPALLKPRPLPDIPDIRMKFIEALKKVEKIPLSMYKTYQMGCKKEAETLLQGVFMEIDDDEDDDFEMNLSAIEQFNYRISQMTEKIIKKETKNYAELVSVLKDRITSLLGECDGVEFDRRLRFSLDAPQLQASHLQIVDGILNLFCKVSPHCLSDEKCDLSWASLVLDMITDIRILHKALFVRILNLSIHQPMKLDEHHISGLALLLAYLSMKSSSFGEVELSPCDSKLCRTPNSFPDKLWTLLPMNTSEQMIIALKLMSTYLFCVFTVVDNSCLMEEDFKSIYPQVLIKKFLFLSRRLLSETRDLVSTADLRIALYISKSDQFHEISRPVQVSFEDWIELEISVDPTRDVLTDFERQEYLYDTIYNHYLPMEKQRGGFHQDYIYACSSILTAIVHTDLRSYTRENVFCKSCLQKNNCVKSKVYFIQVLQELVRYFSTSNSKPWLLSQLKLMTSGEENKQKLEATVKVFFRAVCCLPRYLFFTDTLKDPVLDIDLAVTVINNEIKEGYDCGCTLPRHVFLYIIQAVIEVHRDGRVTDIFQKCPTLVISLLVYLPSIGHLVSQIQHSCAQIQLVTDWLMRAFDGNIGRLVDCDPWLSSAALLSFCVNRGSMDIISQMLSQNKSRINAVLGEFVLMLAAHFSLDSPQLVKALNQLHTICPTVLMSVPEHSIVQQTCSSFTLKLVPYQLLLYLTNRRDNGDYLDKSKFLEIVLRWYSQVVNCHDNPKDDILSEAEISCFVKSCINSSQYHVVVDLDRSLVTQCGVDVIFAIRERLKKS